MSYPTNMNVYSPRLDVCPCGPTSVDKILSTDDALGIFRKMLQKPEMKWRKFDLGTAAFHPSCRNIDLDISKANYFRAG